MTQAHVLCQYQQGEDRGVDLLRQLYSFAPNQDVAEEINLQIEDEIKHARLFAERLQDLDIDCEGLKKSLVSLYDLAQQCVDKKDWVESITVQTVIEELAMATFTEHLAEQDEGTQIVMREIIEDESRHLAFGLREMAKFKAGNEEKINALHKRVVQIVTQAVKDSSYSIQERKILVSTMLKAHKMHDARLKELGLSLPAIVNFAHEVS